MNEWGFIGQETLMVLGKSATSNKFKSRRGYEQTERLVHSNPHSSYLDVTHNSRMSIFNRLFKDDSEEQEPGFYKVEGDELIKFDPSTETKSINDAIHELGFDTTQIHTLHTDYFNCIGVKIFTRNPILILTLDRKTLNMKILNRELKKVDWNFEYSSHTVEAILAEGVENHSLTFDYLNSLLNLKKESEFLFKAIDFELYLTFKDGYLESFASSEWSNAASKWLMDANKELFDTMVSEAMQFHRNEIEAMEEVNLQCEALQAIPYATQNEFVPLHRKPNDTINFYNLLAAHYNSFDGERMKIDTFKVVNKGRFVSIDDRTFEVGQYTYQFDNQGFLTGSTEK